MKMTVRLIIILEVQIFFFANLELETWNRIPEAKEDSESDESDEENEESEDSLEEITLKKRKLPSNVKSIPPKRQKNNNK